eukprot:1898653-Amphidinium_carterae.1
MVAEPLVRGTAIMSWGVASAHSSAPHAALGKMTSIVDREGCRQACHLLGEGGRVEGVAFEL